MKKWIVLVLLIAASINQTYAQYGSARGLLGGMTVGTQRWNGQQRDPLLAWNARFFYESLMEANMSILAELGYHVKGSAIFAQYLSNSGNVFSQTYEMKFNNLSLLLAGKKVYPLNPNMGAYVKLGVRLEYTVSDSLEVFNNFSEGILPFNYGVTLGGGLQIGSEESKMQFLLDLQISPDFSQQIYIPPGNYYNTYTRTYVPFAEQRVINTALELTLGVRFRKY